MSSYKNFICWSDLAKPFSRLTNLSWFDLGYLWQTLLWITKVQLHTYSGNSSAWMMSDVIIVVELFVYHLLVYDMANWLLLLSVAVSQFVIQFWAHLGEYVGGCLNSLPQFVQYCWVSATICYFPCPVYIDVDSWPLSLCLIGSLFPHFSICWHSFGLTQILDITGWISWSMINNKRFLHERMY